MNKNDDRNLMEFKPRLKTNFILFKRTEFNNYYTIKTNNSVVSTKIINATFNYIMTLCDGYHSVNMIIDDIYSKFPKIERTIIKEDVIYVVRKLMDMQGIVNHNLLNLSNKLQKISETHLLKYCDYDDLNSIKEYMSNHKYKFFYKNIKEHITNVELSVLNKGFIYDNPSFMFAVYKNEEIVGIITWRIHFNQIVILDSIIISDDAIDIKMVIKKSISIIYLISKSESKVYKVYISNQEDIKFFLNIGFEQTAIQERELDGSLDLYELSMYM